MDEIKIGGCVVLFNPSDDVIDNILTYLPFLEELAVVDNSTKNNTAINNIIDNEKIHYISMGGNKGIAYALNVGLNYLCSKKYEFALTMDQDSRFPIENYNEILKLLKQNKNTYSVFGLNFNFQTNNKSSNIIEVNYWLTSGNFVNLNDYIDVGGFNSDLFIDYVDIEFCYKLKKSNKKIGYLKDYSLKHTIGNPIKINILGHVYYAMNHSPIRYYYRYRNSYYLYKKDRRFFRKEFFREIIINILKMILFEPSKKAKIQMIRKGIKDAKLKRLGCYDLWWDD